MLLRRIKGVIISILKKRRLEKSSIHLTIDTLPAWNYFEIIKTNDLKHLIISGNPTEKELNDTWEDIHYQILDEFPLPSDVKRQMIAEKYLFLDRINYMITGDEELIHRIEVKKLKLDEMKDKGSNRSHQSSEKQASILHAELGTDINLRVISIARFYHLIELLKAKQSNG